MKQARTRASRITLSILGFLFTGLAILGIFLPVLPTTVWLLLAASCWMRSSTKFYHWLIHNRYLGNYLRNYREHRGITRRHKIFTLALLWFGISVSALILVSRVWLSLLLYGVAVAVTIHILTLKTLINNGVKPVIHTTSPENDD